MLLDFWATWCTFCIKTMPRLNALHQKYKDRGLVIIGLNEFEGNIKGEPATRAQELEYFRQFKRRLNVAYDFAVAADARNDAPTASPRSRRPSSSTAAAASASSRQRERKRRPS